jgi:hypothetical protein
MPSVTPDIVPDIVPDKPEPFLSTVKKRKLGIEQSQAQISSAEAAATEKHLKTALTAVKTGASMTPFLLAAPFTGGLSLGGVAAAGAAEGLASGVIKEGLDVATRQPGEKGKSAAQIARSLTFDAVLGLTGEAVFKGIAMIGGPALEQASLNLASKTAKGKLDIVQLENSSHQAIQDVVKHKIAGYKQVYEDFTAEIAKIPRAGKGSDPGMQELAGFPVKGEVRDLYHAVTDSLHGKKDALGIVHDYALFQPLDVLIRAEKNAMQMAFDLVRGGHKAEAPVVVAVEKFATGLRNIITENMNAVERKAFESTKAVTKLRMEAGIASDFAEQVAKKAIAGAVGGMVAHLPGAAAGVAAEHIATTASKKYGAAFLEWMIANDKIAVRKAVKEMVANPSLVDGYAKQFARKIPKAILKSLPMQAEPAISELSAGGP